MRSTRRHVPAIGSPLVAAALFVIVAVGFWVRLRNIDHGLPFVYSQDEGSHFARIAVGMFSGDANPGYFQNPTAFTYLVHLVLRVSYGGLWPFGSFDDVVGDFRSDPTDIYVAARVTASVVCMTGVVAVFLVGRRLWGARVGLVAALLLSVSFLAVTYSRFALTDVGTLLPVAVALYGSVLAWESGERWTWLVAGAGAGLAIGFKYTAGLVLLPLFVAAIAHLVVRRRERGAVLRDVALGIGACILTFAVTNPYFLLDIDDAWRQVDAQAEFAGDIEKPGQDEGSGITFYAETLGWGFGIVPCALAAIGFVVLLRTDRMRALLLGIFPVALFLYLAFQSRYFGRWLLPAYPALALFAGVGAAWLSDRLLAAVESLRMRHWGPGLAVAPFAAAAAIVPFVHDWHSMGVLGRTDTRELARDHLVENYGSRLRVIIEPAVPARFYRVDGSDVRPELRREKQFQRAIARDVRETHIDYVRLLKPKTIDTYRKLGYCLVLTLSHVRDRASVNNIRPALAYYRRLERESDLVYEASPLSRGADPVPFDFDLSFNYYSRSFERPGPHVRLYRLDDCKQGYGTTQRGAGRPDVPVDARPQGGRRDEEPEGL